ncbi:MAG: alpha/beta fold hydrolase [Desulfobacterales bacterium]|nr:MAG: alpha/beta fold hydrolase [Desulfobacterales bacterium]
MRKDIEFKTEDGVMLRGWFYTPEGARTPVPAIVMAHGYSAVKEMYLDSFADVFCEAGFAVLVYDNRNLGASDGEPRGEIDPWRQINDYRDAITFAGTLSEVDKARIGVWGSSYSGGHVIVVGALDRRVKCVVCQVPLISGLRNAKRLVRSDLLAVSRAYFDADREARYAGKPPVTIPVVTEEPGAPCALPTEDSLQFFMETQKSRAPAWRNEVTLRSIEMFWEYEPGFYISRICPTPFMLVVAAGDHLVPADMACEAFEQALEPKKLLILPGGHFEAYTGEDFKVNSAAQRDWFVQHLKP